MVVYINKKKKTKLFSFKFFFNFTDAYGIMFVTMTMTISNEQLLGSTIEIKLLLKEGVLIFNLIEGHCIRFI